MKLIREHINEKFTEDSDPIQDMNIGIIALWKNALKNEFNVNKYYTQGIYNKYLDIETIYNKFYKKQYYNGDKFDEYAGKSLRILILVLTELVKNPESDKQKVYDEACKDTFKGQGLYTDYWTVVYEIKRLAAHVLKDKFGINVKPYYVKKKKINEKFTEDSDPIHDLGIGILHHDYNFKTISKAENFIIKILPLLLDTNEIPKNIINQASKYINEKYFKKIDTYWSKHIKINNRVTGFRPYELGYKLYRKGFKVVDKNALKYYHSKDNERHIKHI